MNKDQIIKQMNDIRATLQKDQAIILEVLNHIMGCTVLMERLVNEEKNLKVEEDDPIEEH